MTKGNKPTKLEAILPPDWSFTVTGRFVKSVVEEDEKLRNLINQDKLHEAHELFKKDHAEEHKEVLLLASMKHYFLELLKNGEVDEVAEFTEKENPEIILSIINTIIEEAAIMQRDLQKLQKQGNKVLEKISQKIRADKDNG